MKVAYVNLDRRPDRNEQFSKQNANLATFRRVAAVDGHRLEISQLIKEGLILEPLTRYTAGALGCALSHKNLWDECVSSAEITTVAEDDGVLNEHFVEKAVQTLQRLPADWDIILWGWNFNAGITVEWTPEVASVIRFDPSPLGARICEFQRQCYEVRPLRLITAFGTVCYTVSQNGAKTLRDSCFPLRNEVVRFVNGDELINYNVDVIMNKYYPHLQAFIAFPPLVWTDDNKDDSDIGRD